MHIFDISKCESKRYITLHNVTDISHRIANQCIYRVFVNLDWSQELTCTLVDTLPCVYDARANVFQVVASSDERLGEYHRTG